MRVPWLAAVVMCALTGWGPRVSGATAPTGDQPSQVTGTVASALDFEISTIERQILEAVEAMPDSKFNFSPENLSIPGDDYKGVRTFALQVRHVAASNYALWAPLTGETIPESFRGGNGHENLKTKADILRFLKDSFALGHRAVATLTLQNMLQTPEHSTSSRLHLATFAVAHAFDHYGQIVEYLRMKGLCRRRVGDFAANTYLVARASGWTARDNRRSGASTPAG
jgi:hypothetical protein